MPAAQGGEAGLNGWSRKNTSRAQVAPQPPPPLVSAQAGTKREGLLQDWGVTAFGGYTRPAKEAHRGGGSPRLEGQTGLHCPPHKGKSRPQLVAPMPGLCTPRHAVTHPPVAGAAQLGCQLGCEAPRSRCEGGGARGLGACC